MATVSLGIFLSMKDLGTTDLYTSSQNQLQPLQLPCRETYIQSGNRHEKVEREFEDLEVGSAHNTEWHVDTESLVEQSLEKPFYSQVLEDNLKKIVSYGERYSTGPIPHFHIPVAGVDADITYRLIQDELSLGESTMSVHGISGGNISVDGSPILNLASFVQTYMPPMADKLVKENISKNLVGASTFNFGMVSYNSTHLTIRCRRIPGDS
ncbi:glutamate decarboxylase gad1 [Leucoagaricus gongylophorus]